MTRTTLALMVLATVLPSTTHAEWHSQIDYAKIDGKQQVVLWVDAASAVTVWPNKTVRPELRIDCSRGRLITWFFASAFNVEAGNFQQATIRLRFDQAKPITRLWRLSTDNQGVGATGTEIPRLLSNAKTLVVAWTPFNSNPQEVEFNVSGLSVVKGQIESACKTRI